MSKSSTRVTILVGAGLVADAGLPMSVNLASKLRDALAEASVDTSLDEGERALAELQLAAFRFLNGGIRFQEGILNRDPDNPVNIEQIAVAALELQARFENPLAPYTSGWHQRVVELEKQRPDLLECVQILSTMHRAAPQHVRILIMRVRRPRPGHVPLFQAVRYSHAHHVNRKGTDPGGIC